MRALHTFRSPVAPDLAVVRFHGHNADTWQKKGISAAERFDCLYSDAELKALTKTLQKHQATEVSQMGIFERKTPCSQGFWHPRRAGFAFWSAVPQSSLKVRFVALR